MDFNATLKTLDSILAEPKTVSMTKQQFETYVSEQIAKAKDEAKADKEKAKKRIDHLKAVVAELAKGSWDGDVDAKSIPVFEEPDLTRMADRSEKEFPTPPPGNVGVQEDGSSFAASGGQQGFAKNLADLNKAVDTLLDPTATAAKTATPGVTVETKYDWPADLANKEYMKEGVAKANSIWGKDSENAPK